MWGMSLIKPRRGGGRTPPPAVGQGRPYCRLRLIPRTRKVKAAIGRLFLWFVSFGRAKEMNTRICQYCEKYKLYRADAGIHWIPVFTGMTNSRYGVTPAEAGARNAIS